MVYTNGVYELRPKPSEFDHLMGVEDLAPYLEIFDRCEFHILDLDENEGIRFVGNKEADICLRLIRTDKDGRPAFTLPSNYSKPDDLIETDIIYHRAYWKCFTRILEDTAGLSADEIRKYSLPKEVVVQLPIDAYIELISQGKI